MNFDFESYKSTAKGVAQSAAQKAKQLAAIAKANISIYSEEDHIKKAEQELGKLYYRDYAVGEQMDMAEYLPWCRKIDEANKQIAELREYIAALRADETVEEPVKEADFEEVEEVEEAPAEINIEVKDDEE